jgi:ornithine carbamoyltransferase
VTYLDPSGSQLGHKESIADTASVLGRMYDAIEYRGNAQADVEELAEHAGVPVYNGLTDEWHPTQMLADFLTMHESSHKPYDAIAYAFTGDCRFNMGRSLLIMGALMGSDVRLAGPRELHPPADVADLARQIAERTGARVISTPPASATTGGKQPTIHDSPVPIGSGCALTTAHPARRPPDRDRGRRARIGVPRHRASRGNATPVPRRCA